MHTLQNKDMQIRSKIANKIHGTRQQKMILWLNFWQLHVVLAATLTVPNVKKKLNFWRQGEGNENSSFA